MPSKNNKMRQKPIWVVPDFYEGESPDISKQKLYECYNKRIAQLFDDRYLYFKKQFSRACSLFILSQVYNRSVIRQSEDSTHIYDTIIGSACWVGLSCFCVAAATYDAAKVYKTHIQSLQLLKYLMDYQSNLDKQEACLLAYMKNNSLKEFRQLPSHFKQLILAQSLLLVQCRQTERNDQKNSYSMGFVFLVHYLMQAVQFDKQCFQLRVADAKGNLFNEEETLKNLKDNMGKINIKNNEIGFADWQSNYNFLKNPYNDNDDEQHNSSTSLLTLAREQLQQVPSLQQVISSGLCSCYHFIVSSCQRKRVDKSADELDAGHDDEQPCGPQVSCQ